MSGDLSGSGNNPTPWPVPPAPGEQRLRSTTASPLQSPSLAGGAGGGTLQAALEASSPPAAAAAAVPVAAASSSAAAAFSSSSQQTILRGSSSLSVAAAAGANNAEVTSRNRETTQQRFLGGVVGLSRERTHHLRVRKRVPLASNLTAELGVGKELLSGEVTRHAALTYDLNLAGKHLVSLRASPGLVQAARSFTFSLPRSCASAVFRLVAGVTGDGRPVFGFDVDEVRPPKLVAAAAVAALAHGKPLAGAKSVPLFTARVPGIYDSWCGRVEIRASVQRKEAMRKAALAAGSRTTSSSLDLLDGPAATAGDKTNDQIFGPLALDVRELSFVLDV